MSIKNLSFQSGGNKKAIKKQKAAEFNAAISDKKKAKPKKLTEAQKAEQEELHRKAELRRDIEDRQRQKEAEDDLVNLLW